MGTRVSRAVLVSSICVALGACGGSSSGTSRYVLQARLGTFDDGSGRLGTALVATLRDASGNGPAAPWTLTLRDAGGGALTTLPSPGGPGAYVATWDAALAPSAGAYDVVAAGDGDTLRTAVAFADGGGLPLAAAVLSPEGSRIDWPSVAGAAAYLCRVYARGSLVLEATSTTPGCDISSLAVGGYSAEIIALSADVGALGSTVAPAPVLPDRFDVSVARLGFARATSPAAPAMLLRAAGGAYDDGVGQRSLALWLSIASLDGTATTSSWDVEVVGPNLSAEMPLTLTYAANFPRTMVWSPGVPATPGTYTVTARSGATAVSVPLSVGASEWIDVPLGLVATDGAQGSASASWEAVAGARSYLLSAYDGDTGVLVSSAWFAGTSGVFPQGTFTAGRAYEVYVAAADVDMTSSAVPTQVSVAENVFDVSRFVAR